MDEIKMTQEEFEILDRILSGRLHKRERLEVIALIDKEGFSRRPELSVDALANFIRSYDGNHDKGAGDIAEAICAKFTAPEAKQGLSVEEIKQIIWGHGYGYETSPKLEECAQEIHDAHPASSVNAEVVEALQALLVAVCYKTPTIDFGTKKEPNPCYEARVPVQFVHDAHKALNSIKSGKDTKCS